jgi:hypothetical protein
VHVDPFWVDTHRVIRETCAGPAGSRQGRRAVGARRRPTLGLGTNTIRTWKGDARSSDRQQLPVCSFFSHFFQAVEIEEFKREKPTSHTHLSLNTFLVSRGNLWSSWAPGPFPFRSDFEKAMSPSWLPLPLAVSLVSRLPV